jgi:hypothetical protein
VKYLSFFFRSIVSGLIVVATLVFAGLGWNYTEFRGEKQAIRFVAENFVSSIKHENEQQILELTHPGFAPIFKEFRETSYYKQLLNMASYRKRDGAYSYGKDEFGNPRSIYFGIVTTNQSMEFMLDVELIKIKDHWIVVGLRAK